MTLRTPVRRALLFMAAALTFAAVKWVDGNEAPQAARDRSAASTAVQAAASAARKREEPRTDIPAIDLARLKRSGRGASADAFAARSWEPPPRKMTAREIEAQREAMPPPPPPQAPPLPFSYVGKFVSEGGTTVFLAREGRDIAVASGAVIEGAYRVDEVTEDAVVFTYLPLNQRQTISLRAP